MCICNIYTRSDGGSATEHNETETEDGGTRVGRDRLPTLNRLVGDGFNGKRGF